MQKKRKKKGENFVCKKSAKNAHFSIRQALNRDGRKPEKNAFFSLFFDFIEKSEKNAKKCKKTQFLKLTEPARIFLCKKSIF